MDSVLLERLEQKNLFDELYRSNQMLETFASTYGITNIYKDSNLQQLQQCLYLGLNFQPSRKSFDATDDYGHPWELKSATLSKNVRGFSTANPFTKNVLARYRKCFFAFSIYDCSTLIQIYIMHPLQLAELWDKFEVELSHKNVLNNPKIPLNYVTSRGLCVYNLNFNTENKKGITSNDESIYAAESINLMYELEIGDNYDNDI